MATRNLTQYFKQGHAEKGLFWYTGSAALKKGHGMCFDLDYTTTDTGETATDAFGARGRKFIQKPSTSNNLAFAGVATKDYPAKTGGQLVELYLPGSVCPVACGFATTINSTVLTCSVNSADAGRFTFQGFEGRGSALALQTSALADGADIAWKSVDGADTGSLSGSTYTISSTGVGDACGYGDDDIDPTDFVVTILGGADDSTGGDATSGEMAVQGKYKVLTAPDSDSITIDYSSVENGTDGTDPGDCDLCFYITKGDPTVMCYLMDGQESGLQEVISPKDADTDVSIMTGGLTLAAGGYTVTSESGSTLDDGTREGMRKAFTSLGTITNNYKVTVTNGLQVDGSTALDTATFNAADEVVVVEWNGGLGDSSNGAWNEITAVGATLA